MMSERGDSTYWSTAFARSISIRLMTNSVQFPTSADKAALASRMLVHSNYTVTAVIVHSLIHILAAPAVAATTTADFSMSYCYSN